MSTLTQDRKALLAAIIANPDDDTPRLIYADYMDELGDSWVKCSTCKGKKRTIIRKKTVASHKTTIRCKTCNGAGSVRSTSNADRAAFIRLQIELSKAPPAPYQTAQSDMRAIAMTGHGPDYYSIADGVALEDGGAVWDLSPGDRITVITKGAIHNNLLLTRFYNGNAILKRDAMSVQDAYIEQRAKERDYINKYGMEWCISEFNDVLVGMQPKFNRGFPHSITIMGFLEVMRQLENNTFYPTLQMRRILSTTIEECYIHLGPMRRPASVGAENINWTFKGIVPNCITDVIETLYNTSMFDKLKDARKALAKSLIMWAKLQPLPERR